MRIGIWLDWQKKDFERKIFGSGRNRSNILMSFMTEYKITDDIEGFDAE